MTSQDDIHYQVLIHLDIPASGTSTVAQLVLAPEVPLTLTDGRVKRLRDCTLAELQAFADGLEAEAWQAYAGSTLDALMADASIEVTVVATSTDGHPAEAPPGVLDHIVIRDTLEELDRAAEAGLDSVTGDATKPPAEADGQTDEPALVPEETPAAQVDVEQESPPTTAATGDTAEPEAAPAAPQEEDAGRPESEGVTDAAEVAAMEAEPDIRVSEPEPAITEREAPPVPVPAPPPGPLRILGRRRPQGHPTWTAVDILMNEPAFREAQAHAVSSLDKEVAGVLIGPPPEKQPDGRYLVHITDIIVAKHTRMAGASVTYTPESWRYVNDQLAERYPEGDAVIVGWYHTHPGFGIFLSGMDQFIHQNFFTQIWHVALVLDPRARQTGFFCWDRAQSRVDRYEFPWPWWARASW